MIFFRVSTHKIYATVSWTLMWSWIKPFAIHTVIYDLGASKQIKRKNQKLKGMPVPLDTIKWLFSHEILDAHAKDELCVTWVFKSSARSIG